jgi:predicted RNA-binding Zn ribbon-like protein
MEQEAEIPLFQLVGGHVSLDFANTLDNRGRPNQKELLATYPAVVAFAQQTGTIPSEDAQNLVLAATKNPSSADEALRQTIAARDAVFAMFSAIVSGKQAPAAAIEHLNHVLREAISNRILIPGKNHFIWAWDKNGEKLNWILWPIVLQAAELLASDDLSNVRQCASDGCDWLFLDHSKSHSRRWCDMKVCGNRNKARRFYRRQRAQ